MFHLMKSSRNLGSGVTDFLVGAPTMMDGQTGQEICQSPACLLLHMLEMKSALVGARHPLRTGSHARICLRGLV
jgi:hypothetical protein